MEAGQALRGRGDAAVLCVALQCAEDVVGGGPLRLPQIQGLLLGQDIGLPALS